MSRDKAVKVNQDRIKALEECHARYDAKRSALLAQMAKINEEITALQQAQNAETDTLNSKFDAAYAAALAEG